MYSQILAAILKNGRHFNHRVLRGCIHIQYWSVGSYVLLHQILCFYSKVQGFFLSSPTIISALQYYYYPWFWTCSLSNHIQLPGEHTANAADLAQIATRSHCHLVLPGTDLQLSELVRQLHFQVGHTGTRTRNARILLQCSTN